LGHFEALSLGIPTSAERSKQISWGASQTVHRAHLSRFYPPLTRVQFQPGKNLYNAALPGMIAATPKECSMKKTILASIILSLGFAALHAQAKNSGGYISRAKAVSIAKARVGGGKVDNVDFERSSHHGAYYEIDIENRKGEYEVRVNAKTGKVISVHRDDDHDDDDHHHHDDHHHDGM
jgi:hypothetical protein